ncbi:acylneuraminate cytidylyltransferase family protein [Schleiferiaceae bacterium]|nr:acylneuraminate cytidylyltransferase family protein [Schleiferiaceae bacterium]
MKNIALIPLRGGSKGIPGKNLKKLNGTPLCSYAITAALKAQLINEVWISSDNQEIIDYIKSDFPKVYVRIRPAEFATDTASTESVILDLINSNQFKPTDQLILIQATSPLVTSYDLDNALLQLSKSEKNSLISGVEFKRFIWNNEGKPENYDVYNRPRRQDFDGLILENGAFYISNIETIERTKNRIDIPAELYLMTEETAFEIDEISDWIIVENLIKNKTNE